MDQNYVQRYHAATSSKKASKSVWLCVYMYVPASFLFFFIGSCLYAYYQVHPELLEVVKHQVAINQLNSTATATEITQLASSLKLSDYADKVMPHFMVTQIPTGFLGLIISAILSAAMSTISSGMNSSATVFSVDIYKRYFKPDITDKQNLFVLHTGTVIFGLLGMGTGIAIIGVTSLLDTWWKLSGIFAGGVLGLFLLGIISKSSKNTEALIAAIIGILVISWMTFSFLLPEKYAFLRNPFHESMVIVIGTLTIFLVGILLTYAKRKFKSK
jgi:SSS family solute:Na+ symporter